MVRNTYYSCREPGLVPSTEKMKEEEEHLFDFLIPHLRKICTPAFLMSVRVTRKTIFS